MNDFQKLKRTLERCERDEARAEGALATLLDELKDEYDCDSVDAAKALLKQMERTERKLTKRYERDLAAFQEQWDGRDSESD